MRILVIGADGFIGGSLQHFFSSQGHDVLGAVFARDPGKDEVFCDMRDVRSIEELPDEDYDAVINASGVVDQTQPYRQMMAVNAHGVRNLLGRLAHRQCPHFIQLSSIAVYGLRTLGVNRNEHDTRRFRGLLGNRYMRTKAKAEFYIERAPVPCSVLRLPAVIGKGDTFFSPVIVDWLLRREFFFCGSGHKPVSLLYAENLGPCLERIIQHGPLPSPVNCSDFHVTWKEIIAEYARLLDVPMPEEQKSLLSLARFIDRADAHMLFTFSYFGSHFPSDMLTSLTSFKPPHHWKEGVAEGVKSVIGRG